MLDHVWVVVVVNYLLVSGLIYLLFWTEVKTVDVVAGKGKDKWLSTGWVIIGYVIQWFLLTTIATYLKLYFSDYSTADVHIALIAWLINTGILAVLEIVLFWLAYRELSQYIDLDKEGV